MGQKSASESVAAILQAFLRQRTWSQAELAREVGIGVPALRKQIGFLIKGGLPFERQEEHPHVYWSVPQAWFPGGVVYQGEEAAMLLRLLVHLPRTKERERLLKVATQCLSRGADWAAPLVEVVAAREPSAPEAEFLERIEEAAAKRLALRCRYLSSRGRDAWRHLSVQRIVPGPPVRLVAYCHRSERLKWFRVDNVAAAALDPDEPFVRAPVDQVEAMIRSSLDGFADQGPPARYSFLVRLPEARWVAKNLLDGMRAEEIDGGIRVTVETTALPRLARYVVGLGGAARCETPALLEAVAELAQGALRSVAGR